MARDFDNANYLSASSGLGMSSGACTISAWFNKEADAGTDCIVSVDKNSGNNYLALLANTTSNFVQFETRAGAAGTAESAYSTTTWTAGQWHHACGSIDSGDNRSAYLDGGGEGTNSNTNTLPTGLVGIAVASKRSDTNANLFDGAVAEVGIWNVQLTDAEVAVLATGISPLRVRPGNLIHYFPLWGDVGSSERDIVGGMLAAEVSTGHAKLPHPRVLYPASNIIGLAAAGAAPAGRAQINPLRGPIHMRSPV